MLQAGKFFSPLLQGQGTLVHDYSNTEGFVTAQPSRERRPDHIVTSVTAPVGFGTPGCTQDRATPPTNYIQHLYHHTSITMRYLVPLQQTPTCQLPSSFSKMDGKHTHMWAEAQLHVLWHKCSQTFSLTLRSPLLLTDNLPLTLLCVLTTQGFTGKS